LMDLDRKVTRSLLYVPVFLGVLRGCVLALAHSFKETHRFISKEGCNTYIQTAYVLTTSIVCAQSTQTLHVVVCMSTKHCISVYACFTYAVHSQEGLLDTCLPMSHHSLPLVHSQRVHANSSRLHCAHLEASHMRESQQLS
jgi:hypothetical protein